MTSSMGARNSGWEPRSISAIFMLSYFFYKDRKISANAQEARVVKWWRKEALEPLMVLRDYALRTAILPHPLGDIVVELGLSGWLVGFPMISTDQPPTIPLPRVISIVLFGGIVIPTLINTITHTYIITDIYIIICINISSKRVFVSTLGTDIS